MSEDIVCLEHGPDCSGTVEFRMPLSGTGKSFPRCDHHWSKRLDFQEETNRKYMGTQPRDFSWMDAGENWYEDE